MTSAEERESTLRPHVDEARRQVGQLQAAIQTAEQNAHAAYVAGDPAGGDAAHAQAAQLKRQLEAAAAKLEAYETAAGKLAEDRHREQMKAQHARVSQAYADAVAEAQRQAAEIRPALAAAKLALQRAQQAEHLARSLETQRYELEVHLGQRERGKFYANFNQVRAMLEHNPNLADLLLRLDL